MTQAEIVREFAADPAGVALLLSGPGAGALWPPTAGATGDERPAAVRVGPPMRSGVGFVIDLTVGDPAVGEIRGRLALTPGRGEVPLVGTSARLRLSAPEAAPLPLRRRGEEFLDALGSLAIARSSAA
ncbi:MAG TPA: hypothetical protein VFJ98_01440 [Mycobacteriales bacterium]|nr:hypothetical protein [Mycobacteriales bacterium]